MIHIEEDQDIAQKELYDLEDLSNGHRARFSGMKCIVMHLETPKNFC